MPDAPSANNPPTGSDPSGIQSPELTENVKPTRRAIKDVGQLSNIIKRLENENRDRNIKNGRIMAKYNAERPFRLSELENDGLAWKSNFSSQPLATLIDRIAPRFSRAVQSARYLTNSALPGHVPGATKKTEIFRKEFTSLVRKRSEWKDLLNEIAQENALFGYTSVGYTDEYSWWPRHFRQDEFFVFAETKQNSSRCPLIVFRDTFQIHELFEMIEDKEAAEKAGWDIENTVNAINDAMPDSIRSRFSNDSRRYEDLARESNIYASIADGAKVIIAYHAMVVEVTGKVSHYIVDGRSWKYLFVREDRYNSMPEVTTLFSFQQANGNLQASKGVGRTVYALAGIVDRARNEVMDRLQLSGKIIVRGDAKKVNQFKMAVIGNAVVISKDFEVAQTKVDAGVEPFMVLDKWVVSLMDEIAGNVSPTSAAENFKGERVTNGQVDYIADLNNETKDVKVERFMSRLSEMFSQMQRRAGGRFVKDQDAIDFRQRCLEFMTEDEFEYLCNQPSAETVEDYTDRERQIVVAVATEVRNDPLVNAKEAMRAKLTAAVDSDFADQLLVADEDPTVTAEGVRWQEMENALLKMGTQIPVSPRDSDLIHLETLFPAAQQAAESVMQDPTTGVQIMKTFADHAEAHINSALQKGTPKEQVQPFAEQVAKIKQGIQTIAEQAAAITQAAAPADTTG